MICIENLLVSKETLNEKLYSPTVAIGYHRTRADNFLELLKDSGGFKPGGGDYHGVGLYCTRELEGQTDNPDMEPRYGEYIVKFKIPIKNYLIFDKEEAKQVYGDNWEVENQLQLINGKGINNTTRQGELKAIQFTSEHTTKAFFDAHKEELVGEEKNKFNELLKKYFIVDFVSQNYLSGYSREVTETELEFFKKQSIEQQIKILNTLSYPDPILPSISKNSDFRIEYIKSKKTNKEVIIVLLSKRYSPKGKGTQNTEVDSFLIKLKNIMDKYQERTGHISKYFVDNAPYELRQNIQGIIYTGDVDGHSLVAYNYDECIPLSVYIKGIKGFPQEERREKFIQIVNLSFSEYLKLYEKNLLEEIKTQQSKAFIGEDPLNKKYREEILPIRIKASQVLKKIIKDDPKIDLMKLYLQDIMFFKNLLSSERKIPIKLISNMTFPIETFFDHLTGTLNNKFISPLSSKGDYLVEDNFLISFESSLPMLVQGVHGPKPFLKTQLIFYHNQFFKDIKEELIQIQKSDKELLQYFIQEAKKEKSREEEIE